MTSNFEYTKNLQYKVKVLTARLSAFESGEKYISMTSEFKSQISIKDREIKALKNELADAHANTVTVRNWYQEVIEDLEIENIKLKNKHERETEKLKERILKLEIRVDDGKDKLLEKSRELYQALTELDEEKEKNRKLTARINSDYENSSIPSSMKMNRKKIHNSREKTGRKPGGQPGHKGHPRKKHVPTSIINIPPPKEWNSNPDYKLTGTIISKQLINLKISITCDEYRTPEYRHRKTGVRFHADFPEGVMNDVNYGGSIKAFVFLINNRLNVSIKKASCFLSGLTDGKLNISTGMICGLSKQFSQKTESEQKKAFADLIASPVMNVDFTTGRVDGKNKPILICTTPLVTMYFLKSHKGHEGIKGTPVEGYLNTLIHDHDLTFYNYGGRHGECNAHSLRYLKGCMENEPTLKWAAMMRKLLQKMIHFRNSLDADDERNPNEVNPDEVLGFESKYNEILLIAKDEYEYEPPTKYNRDGFNLYQRLLKYKANHLLFLYDRRVSPDNNLAERLLRVIKRKLAQTMGFRSFGGLYYYCQSLGVIATLCAGNSNLYLSVADIFDRQINSDG